MTRTFVVTNPEDGWDCVIGVFTAENEQQVEQYIKDWCLPESSIVHETTLTNIK